MTMDKLRMPWRSLDPQIIAPALAAIIAFLRVMYDDRETKFWRIIFEAMICGFLTMAAGAAIRAMGLESDWSIAAGGAIGFLGSEFVRYTARRIVGQYTNNNR